MSKNGYILRGHYWRFARCSPQTNDLKEIFAAGLRIALLGTDHALKAGWTLQSTGTGAKEFEGTGNDECSKKGRKFHEWLEAVVEFAAGLL